MEGEVIYMAILNEKQIKYGFDYFHRDEPENKCIVEVSEYNGEKALTINCTQLGDSFTPEYKTAKEKNRVVQEWCDFLQNNSDSIYGIDIFYKNASKVIRCCLHPKKS